MNAPVAQQKAELVEYLRSLAPFGWQTLFLNYEIVDTEMQYVSNWMGFALRRKFLRTGVRRTDFERKDNGEPGSKMLPLALNIMKERGTERLTMDLIVRRKGEPSFFLDDGPPARIAPMLAGDLMAEFRDPALTMRYKIYSAEDELLAELE